MPGLLTEYRLQKGEDTARCDKLVTYIQYIPQSCRKKKKTMSINHTVIVPINCTTGDVTSGAAVNTRRPLHLQGCMPSQCVLEVIKIVHLLLRYSFGTFS
jgi:hypothetical protein